MPELLDLVALRSLVEIADEGSFTGAARAQGLSQPAVSQHVRGLETRFGAELITRAGRRIRFTPAGERVLAEARRLLAAHDEAAAALEHLETPPLVVACTEHAVSNVLPGVLAGVERAEPGRRVVVQVDDAERIANGLQHGTIDLAIVLGHNWDAPGDEVGQFALRWMTSRAPHAQNGREVALVVNREPCRIRNHALNLLARSGIPTSIAAESYTLEGVMAATRAGLGTALLPAPHAHPTDLIERHDLPSAGTISVRFVTRKDIPQHLRDAAFRGATAAFGRSDVARSA